MAIYLNKAIRYTKISNYEDNSYEILSDIQFCNDLSYEWSIHIKLYFKWSESL